ncbi:MAG: UbiD family decarboxylase [Planctomycetes bacterium]|nr:UbiD family decarboxylase [Planctomycetota bacterium]
MSSQHEPRAPAVHGNSRPAPRDLRAFLDRLRRDDRVFEIEAQVDPVLEVAEIHRRVIAANGPALVFRNVKGSPFPLVTNLFGTARRVELAFGSRPGALIAQAAKLPEELVPPSLSKLWSKRSLFWSLAKVGMKRGARGAVAEIVQSPPRIRELPALKTWPRDGGRFVTLPLVYTQHPETHGPNLGMYRIQLYDDATCGVHMQIGKGGGFHLAAAEAQGKSLPVNLFIGGPPALILGAIAPLPENVPELLLTSLMLGERVRLADNPHGPLPLVADAEFALVGEIPANERRPEGPFGDHYGYYSETHDYPFMRVKALMHRRDAIYPATVVGKPRQEDFFLGDFLQELLSPLFPVVMPAVRDLWSYGETGYHSLSAAVVRERYKREAMSSAFRILGEGQLSLTKFLLLTNQPVDLRDFRATLEHILARADFRTDLFVFANLSMDSLDYAGPRVNEGGKGVLLGTGDPIRKLKAEFSGTPRAGVRKVRVFSQGCLVVECASHTSEPEAAARIATDPAFADWPLLVLSDDADRHVKSTMNFLWATFTRFNPASDIHAAKVELIANHPSFTPPIVIDARMKAWYPEELFCDEVTAKLVSSRWKEYFPSGLEMGDSDRGHLD